MTDLEAVKLLLKLVLHPQCVFPATFNEIAANEAAVRVGEMVLRVEKMDTIELQAMDVLEKAGRFVILSVPRDDLDSDAETLGLVLPDNAVLRNWIDSAPLSHDDAAAMREVITTHVMGLAMNYVEKI